VERGQITSKALEGNLIGDPAKRTFWVYLPPGYYESDKHYPVVYVLHWDGGNSTTFLERSRDDLEPLILKGEVRDMILVFPDAYTSFGGSQYRSSPTIGDYETYITKEMVDLIDSTYRTIPNRNSRGIMGCSMGGFGTWHLALNYPQVYGVAAPMEGRVDEQWLKDEWDVELTHMNSATSPAKEPNNFGQYFAYPGAGEMELASVAAPNPSSPPFFIDMPFKIVNGKAEIVPEVYKKMESLAIENDIEQYLAQPIRLNNLLFYDNSIFNKTDEMKSRAFEKKITEMGLEHDYKIISGPHCGYDFSPIFKYMNEHLVFEQTE
jgi:pimeloyl-ACP methyl ester carboxylesterase